MLRMLKFGRFNFFKSFRIAITLLKNASKVAVFEHKHYFIFCLSLTILQFITFFLIGHLNVRLKLSAILSEYLAGLNLFEIITESSPINTSQTIFMTLLLWVELFLMFIISSAVAYYAFQKYTKQNQSYSKSFRNAFGRSKYFIIYAGIEVIVLFICYKFAILGNLMYFIWQLSTVFLIPIITFESLNLKEALFKSFNYFKANLTNIISMDLGIELLFIVFALIGYFLYQKIVIEPMQSMADNYVISFIILYFVSTVSIIEVIAFTLLYKMIQER